MLFKSSLSAAVIFVALWATGQAQEPASAVLTLAEQAAQHKEMVLQVLRKRSTSLLPENAFVVADVLMEAENQLDACAAALQVHQQVWQYKVCGSAALQQGLNGLNALQAVNGASVNAAF